MASQSETICNTIWRTHLPFLVRLRHGALFGKLERKHVGFHHRGLRGTKQGTEETRHRQNKGISVQTGSSIQLKLEFDAGANHGAQLRESGTLLRFCQAPTELHIDLHEPQRLH